MDYETILYDKSDGICTITLNRPAVLNAISSRMAAELEDALERVEEDLDTRALVLTGVGDRAFSSGVDLKELAEATQGIDDLPTLVEIRRRLWRHNPWERLAALSKPSVAAIDGLALGGGLELALACDIRMASLRANFGFPEVRLGIIPGRGGTQRLPRLIGRGKALEVILTGDSIDAEEAYRVELVSRLLEPQELLLVARETASKLGGYAPIAVRYAREAVVKGLDMTFDQGLRLEMDLSVLLQTTEDRAEGIAAFKEKRPPRFEGR